MSPAPILRIVRRHRLVGPPEIATIAPRPEGYDVLHHCVCVNRLLDKRQPLKDAQPLVRILVQQRLQQRKEGRADGSAQAALADLVAVTLHDPLRHRVDRERPRLSQLCDGTCDRSCDAVIGSRSSPNRNGNRALKVRARPKKVIHDMSGSSEPVAFEGLALGGANRVVAAIGVASELRVARIVFC